MKNAVTRTPPRSMWMVRRVAVGVKAWAVCGDVQANAGHESAIQRKCSSDCQC